MGIFKKTIKYSKDSKDLNSKIKNLDEDLKKTGVISNPDDVKVQYLEENKNNETNLNEEVNLQEEELYTWRELSEDHNETRPGFLTGRRPSQGQVFPRGIYNK